MRQQRKSENSIERDEQTIRKRDCVMGNSTAGIFDCFVNADTESACGKHLCQNTAGYKERARLQAGQPHAQIYKHIITQFSRSSTMVKPSDRYELNGVVNKLGSGLFCKKHLTKALTEILFTEILQPGIPLCVYVCLHACVCPCPCPFFMF